MLHAVDDVSLQHRRRAKASAWSANRAAARSTLVRLLARLLDPTEGRIVFDGTDLAATPAARFARTPSRAAIQMVFQDPTDSLNPRFTARETIGEPLACCRRLRPRSGRRAGR